MPRSLAFTLSPHIPQRQVFCTKNEKTNISSMNATFSTIVTACISETPFVHIMGIIHPSQKLERAQNCKRNTRAISYKRYFPTSYLPHFPSSHLTILPRQHLHHSSLFLPPANLFLLFDAGAIPTKVSSVSLPT